MEYMLGGGNGVVSVTANVAPREMSELTKACREGDRQAAEMINDKVQGQDDERPFFLRLIPCGYSGL